MQSHMRSHVDFVSDYEHDGVMMLFAFDKVFDYALDKTVLQSMYITPFFYLKRV